ncbi:aminotransferase class III-fold pyridoxal phosphate-dependent enzyme [Jiella endophytica]|uniref:aminotransferase class III-fold pyridoxal phosphate-dependent enzyme n=1 Tax=Jiella endophytica TaxID=2558362 RepID=UPI001FE0647D|nr:aminotransferase class III-fold pyridoxal phosphate-dependent enzyme [Jiella endophytica]
MSLDRTNSLDSRLRERARQVIPGGMFGHLHAKGLPEGYPQFFRSGQGCRLTDVDGREYLDFMCSWGPNVLGHRHPEVEEAVRRQLDLGDCLNGPTEHMVTLAERFVDLLPHAAWALFQKNGTDATTTCVTLSRAKTGRRKILVAAEAYHGAVPWCSPSLLGVTAEDRAHIGTYVYNDVASLEAAVERASGDLAAILVSPFKHDYGKEQALPTPEFAAAARRLADAEDAALVLDEVRCGFRLSMQGSWHALGVEPDLCSWSKAIANGYPLAAVTGGEAFRQAASELFVTGSFWCGGAAMAASVATLAVLEREDGPGHMRRMGQRLRDGIAAQAATHGVDLVNSGPPQMPLILFADDVDYRKGELFARETLARGVYMHPRHNMFLSLAHTEADIDEALEATDAALAAVAQHGA